MLNAVLGDGMSSRLFLSVREELGLAYDVSSGLVDYADAGAFEISAGVDPDRLPAALEAILAELVKLRDEPVPPEELDKAKAYLSGGLELRMDETRHLASWIGGQEALHDRVLTLEEALEAVAAVDAADVARLAGELFRDEGLRLAVVAPARYAARPRASPPSAGMTIAEEPVAQDSDERAADLVLARLHLRLGSLGLARAELESMAGRNSLDDQGIRDLAEVRWRTGDLAGAGDAAAAYLEGAAGGRAGARHRRRDAVPPRPARRGSAAGRAGPCGERRPARHDLRGDAAQLDLAGRHRRAARAGRDALRRPRGAAAGSGPSTRPTQRPMRRRRRHRSEPGDGAAPSDQAGPGLWDADHEHGRPGPAGSRRAARPRPRRARGRPAGAGGSAGWRLRSEPHLRSRRPCST